MVCRLSYRRTKRKMSKKRIFAAVLALGMLTAQSGAFAKVLSDQDFTSGEDHVAPSQGVEVYGGWSAVSTTNALFCHKTNGQIQMYRSLAGNSGTTPDNINVERAITSATADDEYIVFEFDWYREKYEVESVDGKYQITDTAPVVMAPCGANSGVQWVTGVGLYYTNDSNTDIPLLFMSYPYTTEKTDTTTQQLLVTNGTEQPEVKEPKITRSVIGQAGVPKINLSDAGKYRYKIVIDLQEENMVNNKYRYDIYVKAGDGEYKWLTENREYSLTYNEIPTKIRIGGRGKTGKNYTYDFDGDGTATTVCDKTIVDNFQYYTIDTDEEVSKVTYLDGCGNIANEITAGETYTASVTYNNATESTLPLTMVTGFYDADDYFYNSVEDVLTVPTGMGALKGAAKVFDISGGDLVKGFAWSDLDQMIPYAGFDTITAESAPVVDVPAEGEEVTE